MRVRFFLSLENPWHEFIGGTECAFEQSSYRERIIHDCYAFHFIQVYRFISVVLFLVGLFWWNNFLFRLLLYVCVCIGASIFLFHLLPLFLVDLSPSELSSSSSSHSSYIDGSAPTLHLIAYSVNQKGRSEPTVLEDIAINEAEKRTGTYAVCLLYCYHHRFIVHYIKSHLKCSKINKQRVR